MFWAGTIFVALWFAGSREPAPPAPRDLPVQITGCSSELTASLPALVSLEVDVLMRERGLTRSPPPTIAVRCTAARDTVIIEVSLPGARRASNVALGEMAPEHRGRALALTVAELVDALAAPVPEAGAPAQTAVSAQPPVPPLVQVQAQVRSAVPPASAPPTAGSPSLLAGAAVTWLGHPAALLLGARLAYQHPLGAFLTPMFSLDGGLGDAASSGERVAVRTVTGAGHLLLGAGTTLGRQRGLRVEAGPGFRFGWAHLAGQPAAGSILEGRGLSAWWGGPEMRVRATGAWSRGPRLALELAAGLVALPVRGLVNGGAAAYALDGFWLSLALQLGLDLR